MPNHLPDDVLAFWFGEAADYGKRHTRWFEKDAAFDADVTARFRDLPSRLAPSREWVDPARACLARIVALDQFPRHIYRGRPEAFASDAAALSAAKHAIDRGYDRGLLAVERLFMYLPFEHSENLEDQERACALCAPLCDYPETEDAHRYALAHRDIIRRFGRFPHRNTILGRASTLEELEFLKHPGSSF
ncbi:MAG: DUF924 family protein [Burkholderiales bacterium]